MEDHPNDQATAGDGPEAARGRPRRSSRAPATARDEPDGARVLPPTRSSRRAFPFSCLFISVSLLACACGRVLRVFGPFLGLMGPMLGPLEGF